MQVSVIEDVMQWLCVRLRAHAAVEKADSKSADRKVVGVRPPLPAPIKSMVYEINASSDAFFCAQTVPKASNKLRSSCPVLRMACMTFHIAVTVIGGTTR